MQRSSLSARLKRLGFWAGAAFLVTFGVAMVLVVSDQQQQIHDLQSELREVQKDHRDLDGDTITWFWIGSHAEYDRVLERL